MKVAQQEMGPREGEGDGSDNERRDDAESSQGEEEVDETLKTPSPCAPTRRGTQVAIQDTLEHVLVAGRWAGLGVVRRANEIHVKVSG